jgi:hypothetical protein
LEALQNVAAAPLLPCAPPTHPRQQLFFVFIEHGPKVRPKPHIHPPKKEAERQPFVSNPVTLAEHGTPWYFTTFAHLTRTTPEI